MIKYDINLFVLLLTRTFILIIVFMIVNVAVL
jgi:hypothetical protein